jgi:putative ABC transport system ATP-binding protein
MRPKETYGNQNRGLSPATRKYMETIIKTEKLAKLYNPNTSYEVKALWDVDIEIRKGHIVIFSGPSGSGKTTLISLLGAIDRPTKGRAFLMGEELTAMSDVALSRLRRETIGFVFQGFNLIPRLPALDNVALPLIPMCVSLKERHRRASELLHRFQMGERIHHTPEELSGGQQQRVAIARALINNPQVIIADEPTSNIDAEAIRYLTETLYNLKKEGRTIIISTHDQSIFDLADVIYDVKNGEIVGMRENVGAGR